MITACNPQGRPASPTFNRQVMPRLLAALAERDQAWMPAVAMADDGSWCEPGCLLLGTSLALARQWAAEFDQAAWVEYDALGHAHLHWASDTQATRGQECG
nr:DUF3293 domain-containing protein [Pseudomarimonas arenosa]